MFQDPFRQVFIDIPAGEQLLDGPRSRALLAYLLRYKPGAPDLEGVHAFFGDFLARVQGRPEFLRRALALPGLSPWATRDFWEGVTRAKPVCEALPEVREGGRVMPDLVRLRKLREALRTARTFLTRAEVRVFLANGTRERFLATRTATWLTARGFQVVGVGQADRQDYAKSFLILGKGAEAKAEMLRAVLPREVVVISAEAFGVERLGGWPEGADVVLLLGVGFDVGPEGELLRRAAALISDKKGDRLVLLDLRETSIPADFFLVAEGESPLHVRAIAAHLMEKLPVAPRHTEGLADGRWVLLDYGDFVVHLFPHEVRSFYDLEGIWPDKVVEGWTGEARPV